ncbi:MAG: OB-fold putative lipoprotein [Acidobacteriota bacterium]|nr:OB-fold putative lipoprotein [Acidobacteriota bacterium]
MKASLNRIFALHNRGILLDVVVFLLSALLLRFVTMLTLNLVHRAEEDVWAKLAIGFFFAGLLLLQPLGPTLKRRSFHQRTNFLANSTAGCLLFWFMFVYLAMMLVISGAAGILISEVIFEKDSVGSNVGVLVLLGGFVWSIASVVVIYRYFLRPKKEPRWPFLATPQAEQLGNVCMFLNVICLQILWGSLTASESFRELVTSTPLGKSGSFTDVLGRLIVVSALAALVYFPARIFYLVEDRHLKLTSLMMLVANLPLILGVVFASPPARAWSTDNGPIFSTRMVLGHRSFIMSAEDLYREYKRDANAKMKKYSGQFIVVTGIVRAVDIEKENSPGSGVRLDGGGVVQWVTCRFDDDQKGTLMQLRKDQKVTLQGVGERFWIGGPHLNHCFVVNAQ